MPIINLLHCNYVQAESNTLLCGHTLSHWVLPLTTRGIGYGVHLCLSLLLLDFTTFFLQSTLHHCCLGEGPIGILKSKCLMVMILFRYYSEKFKIYQSISYQNGRQMFKADIFQIYPKDYRHSVPKHVNFVFLLDSQRNNHYTGSDTSCHR